MSFCFAWEKRKKSKVVSSVHKKTTTLCPPPPRIFFFSSLLLKSSVGLLGSPQKALFQASSSVRQKVFEITRIIFFSQHEKKIKETSLLLLSPKKPKKKGEGRGIFDFSLSFLFFGEMTRPPLSSSRSLFLTRHPPRDAVNCTPKVDPNRSTSRKDDESRIATRPRR